LRVSSVGAFSVNRPLRSLCPESRLTVFPSLSFLSPSRRPSRRKPNPFSMSYFVIPYSLFPLIAVHLNPVCCDSPPPALPLRCTFYFLQRFSLPHRALTQRVFLFLFQLFAFALDWISFFLPSSPFRTPICFIKAILVFPRAFL